MDIKKNKNRTNFAKVKLSLDEKSNLEKKANRLGLKLTQYMRMVSLNVETSVHKT